MNVTLKYSFITFGGTVINGILGLLFYVLIIRLLGPSDFGLFIIATTTLTLLSDIAELGTNTGLVKFVSTYVTNQQEKALMFLKFAFELKLLVSFIIIILGWFLAPLIAETVFDKSDLTLPLRLAFVGVLSAQLFAFSLSSFQALQNFVAWSNFQIMTNSLRFLIVIILNFAGSFNLITGLTAYITIPLLGFLASLLFMPNFLKVKKGFLVAGEFFHYSKWVALTVFFAAVASRLDTFISGRLLSTAEVGFYGAALQLVVIVPQIMRAIETVIAPKMSAIKSNQEFRSYFKRVYIYIFGLTGLGVLAIPVIVFFIPYLYGNSYSQVVPTIFIVLMMAMLIFLLTVPASSAITYYFGYPKLYTYISALNLFVTASLGWILISNFGVIGAALTVLVNMAFNLIIPMGWLLIKIKK